MKRKILSLILVFAMTVSLLTVGTGAVGPTYGDTAGHWAESSIERWSGHGIIQGSNGLFDPNGQLTCAQLATILAKLLKLPAAKDAGFTDNTADAWYYDAINRCAAAGILNGNGDGTVTPEAPITRERAMVMLARALGIEPLRKPDLTKYTDAAQVSAYAQGYVAALIEAGIVGGVTADELAPQDNINRASTVTILDRAISTYADEAGATVKADGKGIVLVVAENVKITNAPEGTKIVVADGATGLTVNGKSVSDDQTYIVPKNTTSSGSSSSGGHSHSYTSTVTKEPTCTEEGVRTYTCSYDGSTYTEAIPALGHEWGNWKPDGNHLTHTRTCSRSCTETKNCEYTVTTTNDKDTYACSVCGDTYEVEKNSAVRIGTTGYANLADALAADGEDNTIVLLKDLEVAAQINVTKSVTIEGAGYTIKANNASWATGNSYKHLLNITASNVTVQNLTLDSNNQACGNQAWADPSSSKITNVKFTDVTMKGSPNAGLIVKHAEVTAENLTTSDNAWGGVNVDGGTPHFTLTGNSTLNEANKIWAEKRNGPAVVTAEGYYCHLTADGQFYAWSTSVSDNAVAVANDVYYTTLVAAVSDVADGGEIKLIKSSTGGGVGTYGTPKTATQIAAKGFTIDFGGFTYTLSSPAVGSTGYETQGFHLEKATSTIPSITFKNGTIDVAENCSGDMTMLVQNYCNLTLTDMVLDGSNLKGAYYGTGENRQPGPNYTLSNNSNAAAETVIQDTEIIAKEGENVAFDSDKTSKVSVTGNSIIRGKFEVGQNASLSITGGTFSSDPSAYVAEGYFSLPNENSTYTVVTADQITSGVTIQGIAGYEHRAFATVEDAYDEISPKVAALGGLGQETCSKEEFVALYTDDAKITWTIYGKQTLVAGSEGKDAHTFTFGRAASFYRNDCNIAAIIVKGGNDSAALDLSATGGTFALPYNWWGENIKNCEISFTGITFDGVKSIPSTWASQAQSTPYTFDRCTFNGSVYGYHDYNINLTIQNSTFNAPENTAYAVTLQSKTGINGTVTLDHNTFNGYTRGVNLQRPGTDFIFTNNTITSTVSKSDRAAIQLTDGKSFVVTDNTVRVNAGNAFWFHSAATNSDVTYTISNNNIQAPYLGYSAASFDVNSKITSSGNIFNSTDTTRCMEKEATEATATNLTAIH